MRYLLIAAVLLVCCVATAAPKEEEPTAYARFSISCVVDPMPEQIADMKQSMESIAKKLRTNGMPFDGAIDAREFRPAAVRTVTLIVTLNTTKKVSIKKAQEAQAAFYAMSKKDYAPRVTAGLSFTCESPEELRQRIEATRRQKP
jgi:hypothetical protein